MDTDRSPRRWMFIGALLVAVSILGILWGTRSREAAAPVARREHRPTESPRGDASLPLSTGPGVAETELPAADDARVQMEAPSPPAIDETTAKPVTTSDLWSVRIRLEDELGEALTLEDLQAAGVGTGGMLLHYTAADGTTGDGLHVPKIDSLPEVRGGWLRGSGELPARLVLELEGREVGHGIVHPADEEAVVQVALAELRNELAQVRFRVSEGTLVYVDLRGPGKPQRYIGAEQPTYALLNDPDPSIRHGSQEIVVGLKPGRYRYEARLYPDRIADGSLEITFEDRTVLLDEAGGIGSLEGRLGGGAGDEGAFVQVFPLSGALVDANRSIARVEDGAYRVKELPAGPYRVVGYVFDKATLTATMLREEHVDVTPGEPTRLDLSPQPDPRALRTWVLRSETPGFSLTVVDVAPDGSRRTLLDLPHAGPGIRLALPREANLEFRAVEIVRTQESAGPAGPEALGTPGPGEDEVTFVFGG